MSIEQIAGRLKIHDIRPTQQRIKVYEYLLKHPTHPSVDTIYTALSPEYPTFSKTTVYNTLDVLLKAGLIRAVLLSGNEVRYDGNANEHGHFFCRRCSEVYDFEYVLGVTASEELEGFQTERRDLYQFGLCRTCAKEEEKAI